MRAVKLLVALCSVFATSVVNAETGTSLDRTVVKIHTYESFAVIRYAPVHPNSECATDPVLGDQFAVIDFGVNPDAKVMLSVVVAAAATGRIVGFGMNGCFPGWNNVPVIYRVDFK